MTSYLTLIETMSLSCTVFELQRVICRKWSILTQPICLWGWLRSNFAQIFGITVSLGYHVAFVAWSTFKPFWYNTGVWRTHTCTHRHTMTAYTALAYASRGKNDISCAVKYHHTYTINWYIRIIWKLYTPSRARSLYVLLTTVITHHEPVSYSIVFSLMNPSKPLASTQTQHVKTGCSARRCWLTAKIFTYLCVYHVTKCRTSSSKKIYKFVKWASLPPPAAAMAGVAGGHEDYVTDRYIHAGFLGSPWSTSWRRSVWVANYSYVHCRRSNRYYFIQLNSNHHTT